MMLPKKSLLALSVALSTLGLANANAGQIFYSVPFDNVEIQPASMIYVNYRFDSHQQVLVCTSPQENDAITSAEWVYKDASRKIELPITLVDDARFQGHFADPAGMLVITNEFGSSSSSGNIFVSCAYKNLQ